MYQALLQKLGMLVGLSLCLSPIALAAPDTTENTGTKTYHNFPAKLEIAPGLSINIAADKAYRQFTLSLPNKTQQVLAGLDSELTSPPDFDPVMVADYNFDGYQDIATYGGMGGMVNAQFNLYLWNAKQQRFSLFKGDTTNLELDSKHQLIKTSTRSGPRWYETYYASDQGKLYVAIETAMLSAGTQELGFLTYKNKAGVIMKTIVTDLDMALDHSPNVNATVQADKAYLYNQANEASKTAMYVIKDDSVSLKNLAGIENDSAKWCLVEYKGKKTISKWLKCENL
jgi:hypothetical protein